MLSVEELSRKPILLNTLYQGRGEPAYVDEIIKIFTSREDNTFMSYPRLAHFEWKTNVLSYFERIADWLKWVVPVFMMIIGILMLLKWR